MSLETHLQSLTRKHDELEKSIRTEEQRPASDSFTLGKLKREKLTIKEEMESLKSRISQNA